MRHSPPPPPPPPQVLIRPPAPWPVKTKDKEAFKVHVTEHISGLLGRKLHERAEVPPPNGAAAAVHAAAAAAAAALHPCAIRPPPLVTPGSCGRAQPRVPV